MMNCSPGWYAHMILQHGNKAVLFLFAERRMYAIPGNGALPLFQQDYFVAQLSPRRGAPSVRRDSCLHGVRMPSP